MTPRAGILALIGLGCGSSAPPPNNPAGVPVEEPPVALNAEPAVQYPPDLYDHRVEGDVVLRLFADSTGRLAPESTRVAESSGYAAFDSSAVRGAARFRYAPARRHGLPVATAFLQTIEFRHGGGGVSAPAAPAPPRRPTVVDSARASPPVVRAVRDTTRARRDSSGAPAGGSTTPAGAPARPDSTAPRPATDTTRHDTSAAAH